LIKIILFLIQIQLLKLFRSGLIKERLFLYRFRPKVLERQVSSPVDTFSLKSLSNGIYIYKIESEFFRKVENHKTIISNLPQMNVLQNLMHKISHQG
jgi:hypothetical protein